VTLQRETTLQGSRFSKYPSCFCRAVKSWFGTTYMSNLYRKLSTLPSPRRLSISQYTMLFSAPRCTDQRMNSTSACLISSPLQPPTTSPFCAMPVGKNLSAILSSCCNGAPVATYGDIDLNITTCYQYCNITTADFTNNTVMNCLTSSPGVADIKIVCGPAKDSTQSTAPTHRTSTLVWTLMGIVMAGAIIGIDVAL